MNRLAATEAFRKTLYRSVTARGLAFGDPETRSVSTSIMGEFERFIRSHRHYTEKQIAQLASRWFRSCLEIYNDDDLPYKPTPEWRSFLLFLKRVSLHPERYTSDTVAHALQQAIDDFPVELTAIDARGVS